MTNLEPAIPKQNQHLTATHQDAHDQIGDVLIRLQDETVKPYVERINQLNEALAEAVAPRVVTDDDVERAAAAIHHASVCEVIPWEQLTGKEFFAEHVRMCRNHARAALTAVKP